MYAGLNKRKFMYQLIDAVVSEGISPIDLSNLISWRRGTLFFVVDGELDEQKFTEKLKAKDSGGKNSKTSRYFCKQQELFFVDGKTYALSNQWGARTEEAAKLICSHFPKLEISFERE